MLQLPLKLDYNTWITVISDDDVADIRLKLKNCFCFQADNCFLTRLREVTMIGHSSRVNAAFHTWLKTE